MNHELENYKAQCPTNIIILEIPDWVKLLVSLIYNINKPFYTTINFFSLDTLWLL